MVVLCDKTNVKHVCILFYNVELFSDLYFVGNFSHSHSCLTVIFLLQKSVNRSQSVNLSE